ncbi:MAG: hypothetical protein KDB53_12125, partial [Planctomycetes bacterium]|nr:hypothetical protein [Planctomycetota bacterium]
MRDPLHWMPIKYKLPLAFVVLGLLAFGIGGFLVSQFARDALDREIQERLDSSSLSCAQTLDRGLELLRSRCEDFASDGLIRSALEDPSPARREALRTHLIENKIPLVDAFVHGFAIDTDDELVASTMPAFWPRLESLSRLKPDQSGIGRLIPPEGQDSRPGFGIIVPIRSLDGQRQVGRL